MKLYTITAEVGRTTHPYGTVRTLRAAMGCVRRAADEWPGAYVHLVEGEAGLYRRRVAIWYDGLLFVARDPEMVL